MFHFKRVGNPESPDYEVRVDGVLIGKVWRAWFRLGGHGWTHSRAGSVGFATRTEAARDLFRVFRKGGTT